MKFRAAIIALGLVLAFAIVPTASAIEFSILSDATITVNVSETFTVDIALDNAAETSNVGVRGTITGLNAAGAVVTGGVAAQHFFVGFCSPTNCFAGIDTNDNDFYDSSDLSGASISNGYMEGDDEVVIISALSLNATTSDGTIDPGLDGPLDTPSARDVTIMISAATPGTHVLTVGGTFGSGGNQPITNTATITVNVPEPGAIALSMAALGTVFAVAGVRRRA